LPRAKGLTVSELATRLGTTRQHTHCLLTGRRNADARRDELREGFAETFRLRAAADDADRLREVDALGDRLH
jgi:hypothetical protein